MRRSSRAARLEPGNYFAWVNLAEALYLLGDFEGALSANERALSLEVSRPVVNLDRIFFLLVTGRPWRAEDPQKAVATTFQHGALKWLLHAPASARDIALSWEERLVNLALHRRPRGMSDGSYADLKAFERRLDQLQAIFDTFPPSHGNPGRSVAPRSQSTVKVTKLTFSADLRTLTEALSYDGAGAEDTRLYFLFVNGTHTITHGPFSWSDPRFKFPVGAGSIEHSFEPSGGFQAGDRIRATIYIQGNLRAVCRFTVAPGTVDPESACDDFGGGSAYGQGQTAAAPATGYTVRRPGA